MIKDGQDIIKDGQDIIKDGQDIIQDGQDIIQDGQDIVPTFCANGRVKSENQFRVEVNTDHETMTKLN